MEAKYDKYVRVERCDTLPEPAHVGPMNRGKWDEVRAKLRAAPGQWFLLAAVPVGADKDRKLSTTASFGMAPTRLGFEVAVRTVDGERRVYARFIGEKANTTE